MSPLEPLIKTTLTASSSLLSLTERLRRATYLETAGRRQTCMDDASA
jgi:hypothetical protein